jgi:outer membrane protein assembly factor BamB
MMVLSGCLGWPQAGFGPGKSSFNVERSAITPSTVGSVVLRWSAEIAGAEEAVTFNGRIHVLAADGTAPVEVVTLDAASGQPLWSGRVADSGQRGAGYVVVDGDRVRSGHHYTTTDCSASGFCFDHRWGQHMTFDAATGTPLEPASPPSSSEAPTRGAALGGHFLVVAHLPFESEGGGLVVSSRADPSLRFTLPLLSGSAGPVLDETAGRVYDGTPTLQAWALAQCNPCEPLWSFGDRGSLSPAALDETGLYVVDAFAGHLDALDPTTGAVQWTGKLTPTASGDPTTMAARPAVRHGTAYVMTSDGLLQAFEDCGDTTCSPLWTGTLTGTGPTPVATGGLVYAAHQRTRTDGGTDTVVAAYGWSGCGHARCRPLARLHSSGRPIEVLAADDRIVVLTTTGVHVFGLPS